MFEVGEERRRWQEMGGCEEQSGGEILTQIHQNIFSVVKITMFDTYQLSTSVKDVGEGANRDYADALCIGEGHCCMNLVRDTVKREQ